MSYVANSDSKVQFKKALDETSIVEVNNKTDMFNQFLQQISQANEAMKSKNKDDVVISTDSSK